jgi:AcrR family transcriptional regulator
MQDKILFRAIELFTIYGFKSISMDRISKEVGCSTKTLYKFYPNKTIIIKKMVEFGIQRDVNFYRELDKKNLSSISKFLELHSTFFRRHSGNLYPGMIDDLRKYHPEIFSIIEDFLDNKSEKWIIKNLKTGIKEGYFKKNISYTILAHYLIELSLASLSQTNFPSNRFKPGEVYATMIENFIYGISTSKGQLYLDKNFKKYFSE